MPKGFYYSHSKDYSVVYIHYRLLLFDSNNYSVLPITIHDWFVFRENVRGLSPTLSVSNRVNSFDAHGPVRCAGLIKRTIIIIISTSSRT